MASTQTSTSSRTGTHNFGFGLLTGFIPLAVLVGMLLITLAGSWVARALVSGTSFDAQQAVLPLVVGVGLLVTIVAYVVMSVLALRRVRRWRLAGETEHAGGSLWALALSSVLILLPFVLAFVLPQSPAVAK